LPLRNKISSAFAEVVPEFAGALIGSTPAGRLGTGAAEVAGEADPGRSAVTHDEDRCAVGAA
jgi:hypothetical protein